MQCAPTHQNKVVIMSPNRFRLSLSPRFAVFAALVTFPALCYFPAFCCISRALSLFPCFASSPVLCIFLHFVTFPAFVTLPVLCNFFHSFHRLFLTYYADD